MWARKKEVADHGSRTGDQGHAEPATSPEAEGYARRWASLASYPLLEALIGRRSRRFGKGFHLNGGPLEYTSKQAPQPLSLEEEAALAFAAAGITGYALAELPYQTGSLPDAGGGNIMARFVARTVNSGDAIHTTVLFVTDDEGAWLDQEATGNPAHRNRAAY